MILLLFVPCFHTSINGFFCIFFSFGAFGGGGVTWELIKQALIGGENVTRVSVIKPELIIFALVFSVLVGLVSGYQPANKAVKISALEAIRNE